MTTPPDFSPLTGSLVVFCKGIQAALQASIVELAFEGRPAKVYYGEQDRYPSVPSYAVEPVEKRRDLESMKLQRIYDIYFTCQVIGYLSLVDRSTQEIREEIDLLGEKAESILNADHTLGGLTMDLVVETLESGYAYKESGKYKAVILTVRGKSREGLPC